jgi:hypothetical protein
MPLNQCSTLSDLFLYVSEEAEKIHDFESEIKFKKEVEK